MSNYFGTLCTEGLKIRDLYPDVIYLLTFNNRNNVSVVNFEHVIAGWVHYFT